MDFHRAVLYKLTGYPISAVYQDIFSLVPFWLLKKLVYPLLGLTIQGLLHG